MIPFKKHKYVADNGKGTRMCHQDKNDTGTTRINSEVNCKKCLRIMYKKLIKA
jgi:hypothetical protein